MAARGRERAAVAEIARKPATAEEGFEIVRRRLFQPLAITKNLAIAMSAILAITLIPALLPLLM